MSLVIFATDFDHEVTGCPAELGLTELIYLFLGTLWLDFFNPFQLLVFRGNYSLGSNPITRILLLGWTLIRLFHLMSLNKMIGKQSNMP